MEVDCTLLGVFITVPLQSLLESDGEVDWRTLGNMTGEILGQVRTSKYARVTELLPTRRSVLTVPVQLLHAASSKTYIFSCKFSILRFSKCDSCLAMPLQCNTYDLK